VPLQEATIVIDSVYPIYDAECFGVIPPAQFDHCNPPLTFVTQHTPSLFKGCRIHYQDLSVMRAAHDADSQIASVVRAEQMSTFATNLTLRNDRSGPDQLGT
jgi:hypothetical protein